MRRDLALDSGGTWSLQPEWPGLQSFISIEGRRPQCLEGAHTQRQKADEWLPGAGGSGRRDCLVVTGLPLGVMPRC